MRHVRRIWTLVAALLMIALLLGTGAYLGREQLQRIMARWTGEEALEEQLKGTLALAYLRITQPSLETAPLEPIAHTGISPYGVNTFLEQEAELAKVDLSLRYVAQAGFHWIRQEFPWEDIEISAKGDFWDHKWDVSAWAKYDRIIDTADKYGIEIIARLDNPPVWSRAVGNAEGWAMAPPDNLDDYGDFVYEVVSRYKGRIRYYQIWNEPNIYPEWGDQPADPAGFVELLKVAYRRAKEADPDCVVICAALAATTEETPMEFGPRNMSDLLYLEKMYEAGVQGHFDVMGAMVYGLWTGPYDRRMSRDRTNFSRVEMLRDIMVRHGDAQKPLWASEIGWNTLPEDFAGYPTYGRVSPEQQALYATEAYQRAQREWPWMGVMNYWFLRRPSDAEKDQAMYYFRLLEPDFEPMPAYDALSAMAAITPTVQIGYHQEDHWALDYAGEWNLIQDPNAVLGGYALGQAGDQLRFFFEGTDLALVLGNAAQLAQLDVFIDDRQVNLIAAWTAPTTRGTPLTIAHRLRDQPHEVQITVREGTVAIDSLVVWRRTASWPLWVPGVVAAIGLGLVALVKRRRGTANA